MLKKFKVDVLGTKYKCLYVSELDLGAYLDGAEFDEICSIDLETYAHPAFDKTELSGLLPELSLIRTCQIHDGTQTVIMDFLSKAGSFPDVSTRGFKQLQEKLLSTNLIAHNALFETAHLQKYAYRYGLYRPLDIQCTMNMYRLLMHALFASADKRFFKSDLLTLAKNILGVELEKESQLSDWTVKELSEQQLTYCARDAIIPYLLYQEMLPKLEELGLDTVFQLNTKAQEAVAHMNIHGITIDVDKHRELVEEWRKKIDEYRPQCFNLLNQEIEAFTPEEIWEQVIVNVSEEIAALLPETELEFSGPYAQTIQRWLTEAEGVVTQLEDRKTKIQVNRLIKNLKALLVSIDSPQQLGMWLERNLDDEDLENWPRNKPSKRFPDGSLKADSFSFTENEHLDIADPLKDYKKYEKLYSTYGPSFAKFFVRQFRGVSYKLYPNFTLCMTETGRMSSFKPNVQNIPSKGIGSELRKIFKASGPDRTLVVADFSQIEIRVAAYLSQDRVLIDAYDNGIDIHRLTAARTAGKAIEQVSDEERSRAKAPNFALLYLGGAATLKKYAKKTFGIEMTLEHAQKLVTAFRQAYPEFYSWQKAQTRQAERTLECTTPLGKLRKLRPDYAYTTSVNHPVQGAAAELMLLAACFVMQKITKPLKAKDKSNKEVAYAYLVNIVHDEIQIDWAKSYVVEVTTLLRRAMERAMSVVFPEATHNKLAGIKVGVNWKELIEIKEAA